MLRTRRPLLALLLLGVLLAGGYLLSALRADEPAGSTSGRSAPTAGPAAGGTPDSTAGPTAAGAPDGAAGRDPGGAAGRTATGTPGRTAAGGDGPATVRAADLPVEARRVLRLVEAGGPFPYAKDGAVFGNVERLLPQRPRGWYREYTVPTPGERDRGARRIVAGRDGTRYYTADHYDSFRRVEEP